MTYPQTNNTLERKIHFYRAYIGKDDGGRPFPFDPAPALERINALPFTNDENGRYLFDSDRNALCVVDCSDSDNQRIRFCRVRRTGLPQLERAGNISDLDIDPDTGLLEAVHVVFFPDNIVGAEYNHFGPRVSRLGSYLSEKSGNELRPLTSGNELHPLTFRPLLRPDAVEQLDRLTDLRLLDFSISPAYINMVGQVDAGLGDALVANRRVVGEPETVRLLLSSEKENQLGFLNTMRDTLKQLFANGVHENSKRMQVRGKCEDTGRVETINLLNDLFISTQQIVRMNERGRALDPESAFQAIRAARQELGDSLQNASSISP